MSTMSPEVKYMTPEVVKAQWDKWLADSAPWCAPGIARTDALTAVERRICEDAFLTGFAEGLEHARQIVRAK